MYPRIDSACTMRGFECTFVYLKSVYGILYANNKTDDMCTVYTSMLIIQLTII